MKANLNCYRRYLNSSFHSPVLPSGRHRGIGVSAARDTRFKAALSAIFEIGNIQIIGIKVWRTAESSPSNGKNAENQRGYGGSDSLLLGIGAFGLLSHSYLIWLAIRNLDCPRQAQARSFSPLKMRLASPLGTRRHTGCWRRCGIANIERACATRRSSRGHRW